MQVQEGILDDLIPDIDGKTYRLTIGGVLDEEAGTFKVYTRVIQPNDQPLCEIQFSGIAGSFELGGYVLTAATLYGLCVGMKLTPALGRLAYDSYKESVAAEDLSRTGRIKSVFGRFIAKRAAMKSQAAAALRGCLSETIEKHLPSLPGGEPKDSLPPPRKG